MIFKSFADLLIIGNILKLLSFIAAFSLQLTNTFNFVFSCKDDFSDRITKRIVCGFFLIISYFLYSFGVPQEYQGFLKLFLPITAIIAAVSWIIAFFRFLKNSKNKWLHLAIPIVLLAVGIFFTVNIFHMEATAVNQGIQPVYVEEQIQDPTQEVTLPLEEKAKSDLFKIIIVLVATGIVIVAGTILISQYVDSLRVIAIIILIIVVAVLIAIILPWLDIDRENLLVFFRSYQDGAIALILLSAAHIICTIVLSFKLFHCSSGIFSTSVFLVLIWLACGYFLSEKHLLYTDLFIPATASLGALTISTLLIWKNRKKESFLKQIGIAAFVLAISVLLAIIIIYKK